VSLVDFRFFDLDRSRDGPLSKLLLRDRLIERDLRRRLLLDLLRSCDLLRPFDVDSLCSNPTMGDLLRFLDNDLRRSSCDLDLPRSLWGDAVRFLDDDRPRFSSIDCLDVDLARALDNESSRSLDLSTSRDLDLERFLDLDLARFFDGSADWDDISLLL